MTKVVLLKSRLNQRGGVEKYTWQLAEAFSRKGCDVTVLTTGTKPACGSLDAPIKIESLGDPSVLSWLSLNRFAKRAQEWVASHPVDIVFGMDRNGIETHYRAGNGVHKAYLKLRGQTESSLRCASFRINPLHRKILALEKQTYESPRLKRLFVNSHLVKEQLFNCYDIAPDKVSVVHNGVEWKKLQQAFDSWKRVQAQLKDTFNLDPQAHQFLFIGNGYQRKGLGELLEALTYVKDENWQLCCLGKDRRPNHFVRLAKKLGLEDRVRFWGLRQDVVSFYQVADSLVIPSVYDPFANVTVEALAMGLFVVSSSQNGGSEVLTAENGHIVEHISDPIAIAEGLKAALKAPKTEERAHTIRSSVKTLDFSHQLEHIIDQTLS